MESEIPRFIEIRGCINCNASKIIREKTGSDYGFHHEAVISCVLLGCINYGHSISSPFIDPQEIVKKAKETGRKDYIENARRYTLSIKEKFGDFYEKTGVNLDELLEN